MGLCAYRNDMPNVEVNGANLHYDECGRGFPLVCISGALGTGTADFGPQLDAWSERFRVITPDLRGYGKSRPPDRDFRTDFFNQDANDVFGLMRALGFDTFHVAGWSDGANSATLLASVHPQAVSKLVIWGGNSYITLDDIERLERIRSVTDWSPRRREALNRIYGDPLQHLWSAYCDSIRKRYEAGGEICKGQLALIRCQTLILHGAKDPLVPEFQPQTFHLEIAGSRLHILPKGGHSLHLACADEFNKIVMEFLGQS